MLDIYLDIDGVCAAFVEDLCDKLNWKDRLENWPSGVYDLYEALGVEGTEIDNVRSVIEDTNFWKHLTPYQWMSDLIDICQVYGKVSFATSPYPDQPEAAMASAAGRWYWGWKQNLDRVHLTACKDALSRPGAILIDDCDANVDGFFEHGAGGYGILFPQPWNSLHDLASWEQKRRWIESRLQHHAQRCVCRDFFYGSFGR